MKPPSEPAQDPALLGKPVAEPAPVVHKAVPTVSPYAKSFEKAQKALWTGQPAGAQSILHDLLRKSLSRRDKARASKMMGDAEVKKGNKAAAAGWYKKSLRLYEDPDDRDKVSKLLGGLR